MLPPNKVVLPEDALLDPAHADEEMTEKQAATLRHLCKTLDEPMDGKLTQAQAAERIEALQERLNQKG